jgi:hypothetical protein
MSTVARACEAIQPADRDPFLHALAHRLRGETIGDGAIFRAIRDLLGAGAFRTQMTVAVGRNRARESRWCAVLGCGAVGAEP